MIQHIGATVAQLEAPPLRSTASEPTTTPATRPQQLLAARADAVWQQSTPQAAIALAKARRVVFDDDGPPAGAVVGVYGSGKSTLLFTLLREASARGLLVIWEEAAALVARLLPEAEPAPPQRLPERLLAWRTALAGDAAVRARYLDGLRARGRDDVANVLAASITLADAAPAGAPCVVLLDEVEQAHQLLQRRIATDDGQPLRALLDACGPQLRLLLAYAPESFHSLGDADRGRLLRIATPALDVASIQRGWRLDRGAANFAWWVSRGRARGIAQAVESVLRPARAGHFDADLHALGDALDALPGVFGVPALLREGVGHAELRALLDLRPLPLRAGAVVGGVTCDLRDRGALADAACRELSRRIGHHAGLAAVANELMAVLEACADSDERCYLTLEDFTAALRLAQARAIEAGRLDDPICGLVEHGARIFDALGELGPLSHRLPIGIQALAESRCPSPFTDPYLPMADGRVPGGAELMAAYAPLAAGDGPLLVADDGSFAVFADGDQLARYLPAQLARAQSAPLRALLLDEQAPIAPVVELAQCAGRLASVGVSRFHATFLRCLAIRGEDRASRQIGAACAALRDDRQLARKLDWHLGRVAALVEGLHPRAAPCFGEAVGFLRGCEPFRGALARLERNSPALLGLLIALLPLPDDARALAVRTVATLGDGARLRRLAREANPGGRLSGAAVILDGVLPAGGRVPRWSELPQPGADAFAALMARFGPGSGLCAELAALLFAEDRGRLEALIRFGSGELPDVRRELDALAALRRLEETAQRCAAVVADLERCTGRHGGRVGTLRLGTFVDQVRQEDGPISALHELAAAYEAVPADGPLAWFRALGQWLVGVFAARLLKGVERDQVALEDWRRLAQRGAAAGRHADEVAATLTAMGLERLGQALAQRRGRFANALDDRHSAELALAELERWLELVAPLLNELDVAKRALEARAVRLDRALADYLPDIDDVPMQRALLRRSVELLEELDGALPQPGPEGLPGLLEALRQRAESSRRERLRIELEDLLDLPLPADLVAETRDVTAVRAAWAEVDAASRAPLRAILASAGIADADKLARVIAAFSAKRALTAAWQPCDDPLLDALDERERARCDGPEVDVDEVRRLDHARRRCHLALRGAASGLSPRAAAGLTRELGADGPQQIDWPWLEAQLNACADALGAAREAVAALEGSYPTLPDDADSAATTLAQLGLRAEASRAALDAGVERLRALATALDVRGAAPCSIPPDLTIAAAARTEARERRRLRDALEAAARELRATLTALGLGELPAVARDDDELRWHGELAAAEARLDALRPTLARARSLGVAAAEGAAVAGWDALTRALQDAIEAGCAERHALQQRLIVLGRRLAALGGEADATDLLHGTVATARARVAATTAALDAQREARLAAATPAARALYLALARGEGEALAPPLAELCALGLLRTAEAEAEA